MRWPALVGVLALSAVVSIFRATGHVPGRATLPPRTVSVLHLRALRDSILHADLAEGLGARAARVSPGWRGLVAVARDTGGRVSPLADSTLRRVRLAWGRAVGSVPRVPALLIVDDEVRVPFVFPAPGRGGACTTTVWTAGAAWRTGAIGPCAWLATLGTPSPGLSGWLDSTGVLSQAVPAGFVPTDSTLTDYARKYAALGQWAPAAGMTAPAYLAAPAAVACASGRIASCVPAAMLSGRDRQDDGLWSYFGRPSGLGGYQRFLLRDLNSEFGTDRLAVFWHSSGPVPEAFQSAFGVPLDQWLQPRLRDFLGSVELGAGRLGPVALSALLWTLVLGTFTWAVARRLRA